MARKAMNEKALAMKIKFLEEAISNENASEEEKAKAKMDMGELVSSLMKVPGGIDLLLKVDARIADKMEEN